jgi:hypothetical protein
MSLRRTKHNFWRRHGEIVVLGIDRSQSKLKELTKKETCDKCVICCEKKENIKYINCKRGGLQKVNFGKFGSCCKDKPICMECRERCRDKCPFCRKHKLYNIKTIRFNKCKEVYSERIKKINKKKEKKRKKAEKLKKKLEKERKIQYLATHALYYPQQIVYSWSGY